MQSANLLPFPSVKHQNLALVPVGYYSSRSYQRIREDDLSYRIRQLVNRFLDITIPMGRNGQAITVRQLFDDPDARARLLARIQKKLTKRAQKLAQEIVNQYHAALENPLIKESIRFQQQHLTLKILAYALKIISAISKTKILPYSQEFKDFYTLFKFLKRTIDFKDHVEFLAHLSEMWNNSGFAKEMGKVFIDCFELAAETVHVLNDNDCVKLAYKAAGYANDFSPIPEPISAFFESVSPTLSIINLGTAVYGTVTTYQAWAQVDPNETRQSRKDKNIQMAAAAVKLTGEAAKVFAKTTAVAVLAPGAAQVLGGAVIVCAATSAGMGWYRTYQKNKNAFSEKANDKTKPAAEENGTKPADQKLAPTPFKKEPFYRVASYTLDQIPQLAEN